MESFVQMSLREYDILKFGSENLKKELKEEQESHNEDVAQAKKEINDLAEKNGVLDINTWKKDIKQGFQECMRVLADCGVLIFKWNDEQIKFGEILKVIDYKPLFGDKRGKTRWTVFMKESTNE